MPAIKKNHSGSPAESEPDFIAIGRLRSAHGLSGEITMEPWTDFPERIKSGNLLYLGDEHLEVHITGMRGKDRLLLLKLGGYDERESVNTLRNLVVYTRKDELPPLPEGQYYHHELVGLQVVDENEQKLGTIRDILETGAKDVLVIINDDRELLVPLIEETILSIDLSAGKVKIRPQRWD
ncbi:MAG: 16S rRNA processing protein RimM [Anaerolineaceae bacterium]|nr:16S rRNA processing protein RimM [Anaerolineaceae bacterium]